MIIHQARLKILHTHTHTQKPDPLIKFHIANAYIYYINNHNPIHGIKHVIQYPIVGTYVCPVGMPPSLGTTQDCPIGSEVVL